ISLNKDDLIMCLITSVLVLFLIIYDNEYRPDAGLYHLPFTQIINESNIIIGLTNIHSRFGHTSIIQYLSAINYNFFNGINGILIPLASSIVFILIYFLIDLKKIINNKLEKFSLGEFFSLFVVIYIVYKANRYSEFGNDATSHIFLFYIVSSFLYAQNYNIKKINYFYYCSVFCFLNKVFLIFVFLIPAFMAIQNLKKIKKIFFSLPSLIILLWLIKNILISGCLIYPMKITCLKSLSWVDNDKIQAIELEAEAWAKAWPQNKNKNLNMKNFVVDFNWTKAWSEVHLKYILKIIIPYIILVFLIYIYITLYGNDFFKKNLHDKNKLFILFLISGLGILFFILKSPIYRYGYSYLVLLIYLFFIIFLNRINKDRIYKIFNFIFVIGIIVFLSKQFVRIYNYHDVRTYLPIHIFINSNNFNKKYETKKLSENYLFYRSVDECFYGLAPCTNNIRNWEHLRYKKFLIFNKIYLKKNNT
uniref:LIC_10190 family membrane protein n=1 Tax=Candidatus Pelagibacter sp. HIMB1521 TaxID=3413344 RepID=UPI003F83EE79